MNQSTTLTRPQIAAILREHHGSMTEIASSLGIAVVNISKWLKGQNTSKRVADACQQHAQALQSAKARREAA